MGSGCKATSGRTFPRPTLSAVLAARTGRASLKTKAVARVLPWRRMVQVMQEACRTQTLLPCAAELSRVRCLVAGGIGIVSAPIGPVSPVRAVGSISSGGGCSDGGSSNSRSSDACRNSRTIGASAIAAISTGAISSAIGATVIDAAAMNGAICQGVTRNHRQATDADDCGCAKGDNSSGRHDRSPVSGHSVPILTQANQYQSWRNGCAALGETAALRLDLRVQQETTAIPLPGSAFIGNSERGYLPLGPGALPHGHLRRNALPLRPLIA